MKQTIKIICSILLLVVLFMTINVSATPKGSSETFKVNVTAKDNIQSGSISLVYDQNALELTSASWTISGTLIQDFNKTTNDGVFAYVAGQVVGGNIFSMTFKVKDAATIGKYEIGVVVKLVDTSNQPSIQNRTYTIDVECSHDYSSEIVDDKYLKNEATCATPKTYYKSCKYCGEKGTSTFTIGTTTEHNFIFKNEIAVYIAKPGTCTTKTEYYYACSGCGKASTITYVGSEIPSHDFSDEWVRTNLVHYHECSKCEELADVANHTPGAEPTEDTPQTCTVCGYVIKPPLGHEHNFDTSVYKTDEKNHWYECACGDRTEVNEHIYDDDCDSDCNGCGYVRVANHTFGDWVSDNENHWKECSCGEKSELSNHVLTDGDPQICVVCNYVLKEETTHTHEFSAEWHYDLNSHWHECTCGEKNNVAEHKLDNEIVIEEPTTSVEGVKRYSCACGYEKLELIPMLEKEAGCKLANYGLLITIIVGGVVIVTAGILVISRKKR